VPEALPAHYDVLVIGGGPAGSTCARVLTAGGARVAVIDRAEFPRVKLCGGWLSPGFWDVVQLAPSAYPRGLWEWHTCHIHYRGKTHAIACHGWFIRRFELDDFLLRTSGAELHLGMPVKHITRDPDGLWSVGGLRARYLDIVARLDEKPLEDAARAELRAAAERLNPDTWRTADEVALALEQYETVFESLRAVVGRHPRRRV